MKREIILGLALLLGAALWGCSTQEEASSQPESAVSAPVEGSSAWEGSSSALLESAPYSTENATGEVTINKGSDPELTLRYPEVPEEFAQAVISCTQQWMDATFDCGIQIDDYYCKDLIINQVSTDEQKLCCFARFYFHCEEMTKWPFPWAYFSAKGKSNYMFGRHFLLVCTDGVWAIAEEGDNVSLPEEEDVIKVSGDVDPGLPQRYPELPEELEEAVRSSVQQWMDFQFSVEADPNSVLDYYCENLEIYQVSPDEQQVCFRVDIYFKPVNPNLPQWQAGNTQEIEGNYLLWRREMRILCTAGHWGVAGAGTGGVRLPEE